MVSPARQRREEWLTDLIVNEREHSDRAGGHNPECRFYSINVAIKIEQVPVDSRNGQADAPFSKRAAAGVLP